MSGHAETRQGQTGGFQEDSAAGGRRTTTVPHAKAETEQAAICRDYWSAAKRRYLHGDHPDYATPDWRALAPEDPRKLAGALAFAEMWRKFGDEIADDLNRRLATPHELVHYATRESCEAAWQQLLAKQQRRREAA